MGPTIFEHCSADPALTALLGSSPFRMFPAGEAPQDTTKPYVAWQVISGETQNYIGTRPDMDRFDIQVDVYSPTLAAAREIARAIRTSVEERCHMTSFRGESREIDTRLYRVSFDLSWFEPVS